MSEIIIQGENGCCGRNIPISHFLLSLTHNAMIMIMMIITKLPVNIMNDKILRANLKSQEKEEEFGEDRLGRVRTCLWDLLEYPETSKVVALVT